jgi:hypothetical protein
MDLIMDSSFLLDEEDYNLMLFNHLWPTSRWPCYPFPCRKDELKAQIVQTTLKTISDYFVTVMASSLRQIKFVMTKMEDIGAYTMEMAKLDAWIFKPMYSTADILDYFLENIFNLYLITL